MFKKKFVEFVFSKTKTQKNGIFNFQINFWLLKDQNKKKIVYKEFQLEKSFFRRKKYINGLFSERIEYSFQIEFSVSTSFQFVSNCFNLF